MKAIGASSNLECWVLARDKHVYVSVAGKKRIKVALTVGICVVLVSGFSSWVCADYLAFNVPIWTQQRAFISASSEMTGVIQPSFEKIKNDDFELSK